MKVKNDHAAAAAGFHWEAGQEVEVPDEIAAQLFTIQDGGFYSPEEFPDGFSGRPRHIAPEGPGPTTKAADWPTDGDDPAKESTTKESLFVNPEELKPKSRRKQAAKAESEVDPKEPQSEVDPEAGADGSDDAA